MRNLIIISLFLFGCGDSKNEKVNPAQKQTQRVHPVQTQRVHPVQTQRVHPVQTQRVHPVQTQRVHPVQTQRVHPVQTQRVHPVQTQQTKKPSQSISTSALAKAEKRCLAICSDTEKMREKALKRGYDLSDDELEDPEVIQYCIESCMSIARSRRKVSNKQVETHLRSTIGSVVRANTSHSYACVDNYGNGKRRVYRLNLYPSGHSSGLVCKAYRDESVLWTARNDRDYCGRNLLGIINTMSDNGYSCKIN